MVRASGLLSYSPFGASIGTKHQSELQGICPNTICVSENLFILQNHTHEKC